MNVYELHITNYDGQTFSQLCHSYTKARWLLMQHLAGIDFKMLFDGDCIDTTMGGRTVYDGGGIEFTITELLVI